MLSFNQAASVLNYAQSTISAQIRSLENSLGKELFFRSGKTISLTPAGAKLLDFTQRLVNIEKEVRSVLGNIDDKYGNLTIKTPQSVSAYFFPDLLKEFQLLFPKIGFDIDWCTSFNLLDIFRSGTIDLAFLITDSFKDKGLQTEELTKIKLVLAASPEHELLRKNKIKIEDLNGQTILYVKSDCNYKKILQQILIQANVKVEKVIDINSLDAIKCLVRLGTGIAFLPEIVISDELKNGTLKTLNWAGHDFGAKLFMIWSNERHISEPLSAFMLMVRKMF